MLARRLLTNEEKIPGNCGQIHNQARHAGRRCHLGSFQPHQSIDLVRWDCLPLKLVLHFSCYAFRFKQQQRWFRQRHMEKVNLMITRGPSSDVLHTHGKMCDGKLLPYSVFMALGVWRLCQIMKKKNTSCQLIKSSLRIMTTNNFESVKLQRLGD